MIEYTPHFLFQNVETLSLWPRVNVLELEKYEQNAFQILRAFLIDHLILCLEGMYISSTIHMLLMVTSMQHSSIGMQGLYWNPFKVE